MYSKYVFFTQNVCVKFILNLCSMYILTSMDWILLCWINILRLIFLRIIKVTRSNNGSAVCSYHMDIPENIRFHQFSLLLD